MRKLKVTNGLRALLMAATLSFSSLLLAGGILLQLNATGTHDEAQWQASQVPIKWYLSEDGLPGSSISNTELAAILQTAFATWEGVTTSNISFSYEGEFPERLSGVDGKSLITFTDHDYVFQENELAFAITYTFLKDTTITDAENDLDGDGVADLPNGDYPAGAIYEADIVFNASHPFADTGEDFSIDIQAVALHEIGHLIGLSHSIVPGAVMHPFLSSDIASARTLEADDIAYGSYHYPSASYDTTFGSVSGFITNGFGGQPILGAHVYAVDVATSTKTVGAYSLQSGDYRIPGLVPGNYYIGIEPLDGDPLEADPKRINEVIKDTFDTHFASEFYDANESNIESNPNNAQIVTVTTSNTTADINIITNTTTVPGVGVTLQPGLNLFAYPVETPVGFTVFDLLEHIGEGNSGVINSIDRYNPETGRYERAIMNGTTTEGIDFDIKRGEGYLLHMNVLKVVSFEGDQSCPLVNTTRGFNLIGVPCPPAGYGAYDLLQSIGPGVISVQRYNDDTGQFEIASLDAAGEPVGTNFPVANGVAYVVETLADKTGVSLPGLQNIFPPYIDSISPGRGVIGTEVMIIGQGFSDDVIANDVTFNGVRAAVSYASGGQLVVRVPSGATTGPVTVATAGKVSEPIDFVVEPSLVNEVDLQGKDMVDGQTVQGSLDSNGEQDRYSFIVSRGSLITATAMSTTGVPDLWLYLEGPDGEVLTKDENSNDGPNAKIERFEAPRSGRFTIVVAARSGSGSGAYTLNLNIEGIPPLPDIAIMSGDHQTGLMGTQLPVPLEVLVIGPNGAPLADAAVDVITSDADNIVVTNGFTAATFFAKTNSSGIVTINMTLPNTAGVYNIVIDIPGLTGYKPKTIRASSVPSLPVTVQIDGNGQTCGGSGCPVDQPLPEPYKLTFKDSGGLPVEGVLTKFTVVSGGGKFSPGNDTELSMVSNAVGEVAVTHHLGKIISDQKTGLPIPQIVAATGTNPGTELWLFESIATAGTAANISSLKTSHMRMTMGTVVFNAIRIKVTDAFGNPVTGADITATPSGGLEVSTFIDGAFSSVLQTDNQGEFTGALLADFQGIPFDVAILPEASPEIGPGPYTIRYGQTGVVPTLDEFGARVPGTVPYPVTLSVGSASYTFDVEVDMGPRLVTIDEGVGLVPETPGWIGQPMAKPIIMKVISYQRTDGCKGAVGALRTSADEVQDGDGGDWRDEDFSLERIRSWSYTGLTVNYSSVRTDGNPDITTQLSPSTVNMEVNSGSANFDFSYWTNPSNVTLGDVQGSIRVDAITDSYNNLYGRDDVCLLEPLDIVLNGVSGFIQLSNPSATDLLPVYIGIQRGIPQLLGDVIWSPLENALTVDAVSPAIEVIVNEQTLTEPVPDPLQPTTSYSGLNLTKLGITLNSNDIFSGTLIMNQYPNYMQAEINGNSLNLIDTTVKESYAPNQFKFIYYPTAGELDLVGGDNTVDVTGIEDYVGNTGTDQQTIFIAP